MECNLSLMWETLTSFFLRSTFFVEYRTGCTISHRAHPKQSSYPTSENDEYQGTWRVFLTSGKAGLALEQARTCHTHAILSKFPGTGLARIRVCDKSRPGAGLERSYMIT